MNYNEKSAKNLGWSPMWFGTTDFGEVLTKKVKEFQTRKGLKPDGLVGVATFAALYEHFREMSSMDPLLIVNGERLDIDYDIEVSLKNFGKFNKSNYKPHAPREVDFAIIHWDATFSADDCFNILQRRGVSTHFCIDNDGTIQQYLDIKHVAYHARGYNSRSVGIDISNAFYLKYADRYVKMGLPERPVINSTVHGRDLGDHLGYYPEQIYSFKCLLKTLIKNRILNSSVTAYNEDGSMHEGVWDMEKESGGIFHHYHLTENKIDTAGIDLAKIIKECTDELYDEGVFK